VFRKRFGRSAGIPMRPPSASLRPLVTDLRQRARDGGWSGLVADVRRKSRTAIKSEQRLIVLAKDLSDVTPGTGTAEVRIEDLGVRHLPALAELNRKRGFMRADRRFARDLEYGYHGYAGFVGSELIGYYWWVDRTSAPLHPDLANLGLDIHLGEGDVYGYDYFVLEQFRGGGVAGELLNRVEGDLARRGYRTLWGYVVSDNRPARWLYSLRGYRPMRTVLRTTTLLRKHSEPLPN
jgi:GNAT superfamily N-acetyltransferase